MLGVINSPMMQTYLASNPNSMFARTAAPQSAPQANPVPSFAAGGMLRNGGPLRPGQKMDAVPADEPALGADSAVPMDSAQIDQEARNFAKANPEAMQKIQAVLTQAMQSGELTPDELNLAVQLAKAALANPASYPQIRQFAIQNGLGTEADLPQEVDRGLLFVLLVAGSAMQAPGSASATPAGDAIEGKKPAGLVPQYEDGGMTKGGLAQLHGEEYVATKEAVLYHGKKTYDKLEEQARTPKDAGSGS